MAGDGGANLDLTPASGSEAERAAAKVQIYAAAANAAFADKVAQGLDAEGFSIVTGDFEKSGADAVVVIWSGTAIGSRRLIEAALAPLKRGALVPVSIGKIEPPDAFKSPSPVDLSNWSGATTDPRWRVVVDEIRRMLKSRDARSAAREGAAQTPAPAAKADAQPAGDASFLSWFEPPYTDDDAPKPAVAAAVGFDCVEPPLVRKAPPRPSSPTLVAGFGLIAVALFAGFFLMLKARDAAAPKTPASRDVAAAIGAEPAKSGPESIQREPGAAGRATTPTNATNPPGGEAVAAPALATLQEIGSHNDQTGQTDQTAGEQVVSESGSAQASTPSQTLPAAGDEIAELIAQHVDDAPTLQAAQTSDAGDAVGTAPAEPAVAPAGPAKSAWIKDCDACPELAVIPAGRFKMGASGAGKSPKAEEGPVVEIALARPFAIARRETTVGEWRRCVAAKACPAAPDTGWPGDNLPVTNVSWGDAQLYLRWLSQTTGKRYRLPSEAEWEYAALAGASTAFSFGSKLSAKDASFDGSLPVGGAAGPILKRPKPVASYPQNAFGLYDMHGNVWEWTEDCWASSRRGAPVDGSAREGNCAARVIKGGAWNSGGWRLRAAHRIGKNAAAREFDNGFRVVRDLP